MAYNETAPARNEKEIDALRGKEKADALYNQKLRTAATVGQTRGKIDEVLTEVDGDIEAQKRAKEIQTGVSKVAGSGANDINLKDDLGAGVLGNNRLGTTDSNMTRKLLTAEEVTVDTRLAVDTALHEHDPEVGHRGQDANAHLDVITASGEKKKAVVALEGNVVTKVGQKVGGIRSDLPEETYKEGARMAQQIGVEKLDSYIRKGGANVGKPLQTELWRQQTKLEIHEMIAQGAQVGIERNEVIRIAREDLGRRDAVPAGELQVAMAA